MFSEERHYGIKEQGIVRGGVRRGGYDGRISIDLSNSLQLVNNVPLDKNVTVSLFALQVSVDIKDDYYRQYSLFYLMEGRLLDCESIHRAATSVSY